MIREAEKSHPLSLARQEPRVVSGIIESEYKGLRTRGANNVYPSLRTGEDGMR